MILSTAVLVFLAYAAIDGFYAKYTLDVVAHKPFAAATIGSLMHFLLAFGVLSYTENWLYLFPLAAGSWVGTFITVKRAKVRAALNPFPIKKEL